MVIEAGIFDLGGVVVKSSDIKDIKDELEIDPGTLWEVVRVIANDVQTGRVTEDELLEFLRNKLGLDEVPYDLFARKYLEGFEKPPSPINSAMLS